MPRATYPDAAATDLNFLGRGACQHYNRDWWTGDHDGSGHANCHHGLARHICIRHCPVYEQCRAEATARPQRYASTVMGGLLLLYEPHASRDNVRPAKRQPGTVACTTTITPACTANAEEVHTA